MQDKDIQRHRSVLGEALGLPAEVIAYAQFSTMVFILRSLKNLDTSTSVRLNQATVHQKFQSTIQRALSVGYDAIFPSQEHVSIGNQTEKAKLLSELAFWVFGRSDKKKRSGLRHSKTEKKTRSTSLSLTMYQARQFFGLEAPNNTVNKFERWFNDIGKDGEARKRKPHSVSVLPEKRMLEWGDYAAQLVACNGGIKSLADMSSFDELQDLWPPKSTFTRSGIPGNDSFLKRIVSLSTNDYLQILTMPVGILWPLWLVRNERYKKFLSDLQKEGYSDMPSLKTDLNLYFDISTNPLDLASTPYPFGFAYDAVSHAFETDSLSVSNKVWTPKGLERVAKTLENEQWSPPLLICGRGDQWNSQHVERPLEKQRDRSQSNNKPVPIIKIAEPCDRFSQVYCGKSSPADTALVLHFEAGSFGERVSNGMQRVKANVSSQRLSREKMQKPLPHATKNTLVLTYFPQELAWAASEEYEYLELTSLPGQSRLSDPRNMSSLSYLLPSAVLIGGSTIVEHTKMLRLIQKLGEIIWTVKCVFEHLIPFPELLEDVFGRIRSAELRNKQVLVQEVRRIFKSFVAGSTKSTQISEIVVEELSALGMEMSRADHFDTENQQKEFENNYASWGWVLIIELIPFTCADITVHIYATGEGT